MSQAIVMYRKEMLEMSRNYKWVWVPLVFIILGLLQPISTYYMPQILEANGVPQEVFEAMPVPTGTEVLVQTLSQYSTIGLLILVLSFMGVVAAERQSGSAVLVMVKPLPHHTYIISKWTGMLTLTLSGFFLGFLTSWYYTGELIGKVPFEAFIKSFCVYGLWLVFIATVTLFFSSLIKTSGAVAFLSILTVAALSLVSSLLSSYMQWSPGMLSGHAGAILSTGEPNSHFWLSIIITFVLIVLLISATIALFRRADIGE